MDTQAKADQLAEEMSRFEQEIMGASARAPKGPTPPQPPPHAAIPSSQPKPLFPPPGAPQPNFHHPGAPPPGGVPYRAPPPGPPRGLPPGAPRGLLPGPPRGPPPGPPRGPPPGPPGPPRGPPPGPTGPPGPPRGPPPGAPRGPPPSTLGGQPLGTPGGPPPGTLSGPPPAPTGGPPHGPPRGPPPGAPRGELPGPPGGPPPGPPGGPPPGPPGGPPPGAPRFPPPGGPSFPPPGAQMAPPFQHRNHPLEGGMHPGPPHAMTHFPPRHMGNTQAPMIPQQPAAPVMMPVPIPMQTPPVPTAMLSAILESTKKQAEAVDLESLPLPQKAPKRRKDPKKLRTGGGKVWEDQSLEDWDPNDFRIFCGDLGNDVNDDTLARAFTKFPSFLKAKVIRDRYTKKTKGYGFVSFKDPHDFMQAMREVNGKYIGNRPVKLRKSVWKDRCLLVTKKKEKEKKRLGFR